MRNLHVSAVLLFYDYPQVFVAKDAVGSSFICMATEEGEDGPIYLCTPISRERRTALLSARLDLRCAFAQPEIAEFRRARFSGQMQGFLETTVASYETVPIDILPAEGMVFDSYDEVALSALELNSTVSHVALGVPEAEFAARIHSATLAEFLSIFQAAMRSLARFKAKSSGKRLKREDDSFNTDVYGFAKGSFTIKFRPSADGDMFGETPAFSAALGMLNEFLALSSNADAAIAFLQAVKGHSAASLIKMLRFLAENSCPVDVKWATPGMLKAVCGSANLIEIKELVARCSQRSDLSVEEVTLAGMVLAADFDNNTWKMLSENDQEIHSGEVLASSSASLRGLVITDARYEFICEETIEVVEATGRELRRLLLRSVRRLD